MTNQSPAVFGLYPSTRALHIGAEALRAARFRQTDISVLYSDGATAFRLRESIEDTGVADGQEQSASLGNVVGALSGVGAVTMRDDGPFLVAGPLLAALAGVGELHSSLRGLGIPVPQIGQFEHSLRKGGLLLSVQCEDYDWSRRARQILHDTGAETVASTSEVMA